MSGVHCADTSQFIMGDDHINSHYCKEFKYTMKENCEKNLCAIVIKLNHKNMHKDSHYIILYIVITGCRLPKKLCMCPILAIFSSESFETVSLYFPIGIINRRCMKKCMDMQQPLAKQHYSVVHLLAIVE